MNGFVRKLILLSAAFAAGIETFAQTNIKVDAPGIVGSDERFNVTFIIEGEDRPSAFDWTPGDDFTLVWGPQTGSSTSISIVNGKRSKTSQFTYTYIIAPKSTGSFELPQATAKVNGETISSGKVSVKVLEGEASSGQSQGAQSSGGNAVPQSQSSGGGISSEDMFLRFTLSRTSAVIGEPITAELKLYQRVDIAGFEGAKFPSFNGFWSKETAAPTNIEFHREDFGGKIYNVALLRRYVLIPQQEGNLTIEPAELVCLVNVRTQSRGNSIFDSFFDMGVNTVRKRITTPSVQVNVKPLPGGAPASFGGGVGDFRISAKLSKDGLKTHEATSLVVTLSGTGNVSLLEAPKVNFPPDMEVYDVKITENTGKSSGGTSGNKVFEYPFIPRSYGVFTIDPIQYSYYDVNTGKYKTIQTEPIVLNVEKGENSDSQDSGATLVTPDRKDVRTLGEDVRFIRTRIPEYRFKTEFFVSSWLFWALVAFMAAFTGGVWALFRNMETRRADVAGSRKRKATKRALARLKAADNFLKKNLYSAFYEELHKALLGYVSDRLNIGVEELNKENIAAELIRHNVSEELAGRLVVLVDACEFARYSPDGCNEAMASHYDEAADVITAIDSVMKGHDRKMKAGAAGIAALLLSVSYGADAQGNAEYLDSLWNTGTEAYMAGRWTDCADSWKSIEDLGVVSPELYYNLGNACYKSGDNARAILYYERTLKSDPSFGDARFNLELANAAIRDRIDAVPEFVLKTWARKISCLMGSNAWAWLSLCLLAAAFALFLLFRLSGQMGARRAGFYCSILAVLLSSCAFGFSLWQRNSFLKADYAIVMSPVSSVKSAPGSDSSKDLLILHEGTKVKILDSVGDWRNISLSDGRQGWIPADEIEVI